MSNLPAHLQNRTRRDLATAAISGLSLGSPPHISIAGNRFTLVDDAGNEKPINTLNLDVCIIDANPSVSKIYFDPSKPFVPGGDNASPPICWSDNGIGASAQAAQPQHTSCQLCPHNAWGSAQSKATGADTKACNDVKKLAVLVPGLDVVFLLRVPPASLKHLAKYTQTIKGHGVDLPDAITRIEFESQGILKFTPVGYVDEATAALSEKIWASNSTEQLVGKTDWPFQGQLAGPKEQYAARQNGQLPPPPNRPQQEAQAAPQTPFGATHAPNAVGFGQSPSMPAQPVETRSPSDPFGQPGTSSPTAATPEKAPRKPRAKAAETAPAADESIPPFLRNQSSAPLNAPSAAGFGMNPNPPAPDAGIQAALDAAFNLPT